MVTPSMTDAKAWIGAADAACYAAKHQGRARLQLAT
jgi:PleD family two-component response regulator